MTIETDRTTIRQLRATSTDRDPFAYQLRLASMLSSADLHPPGVSVSAIICIRSLYAPPLSSQALRYGGGRLPLSWEEQVRTLIKQALQHASHPLHETVPPDCEAIIFADRAELLASLASDWCTGDSSYRWWWHSLFRSGPIEQFLLPAWLETPEYIPSALHLLATQHKATTFVRRLPLPEVRTLLNSIIRRFALHELQTALATAFSPQHFLSSSPLAVPTLATFTSQAHEHAPSTADISKTTAIIATKATTNTSEISKTMATIARIATTNTSEISATSETLSPTTTSSTTTTHTPSPSPSLLESDSQPNLTVPLGLTESDSQPTHPTPPNLLESDSQPAVGADLSRPPADLSARPVGSNLHHIVQSHNRPVSPSLPAQDERAILTTPLSTSPWLPSAPESADPSLSPEQQTLLGVSLMLQRVPSQVRTTSFAQSLNLWYSTANHTAPQYPLPANISANPPTLSSHRPRPATDNPPKIKATNADSIAENLIDTDLNHTSHPKFPNSTPTTEEGSRVHGRGTPRGYPGAVGAGIVNEPRGEVTQIETAYGGLFYLINLAQFLNLYGDFTTPLQPGIALPIWDFVALLAQQMLGEQIVADPLWPLLAQLTGRHVEEPPGHYFAPPDLWRIPPAWLSAFPEEDAWSWSIDNERLQVLHPAQFLLLDVPLDINNPAEHLSHELSSYVNVHSQGMPPLPYTPAPLFTSAKLLPCGRSAVNNLDNSLPPPLQRWLLWLMPYVYARLQRALGLDETQDPSSKVCKHDASIVMTATDVHITLALSALPIEIRIAGLDRDPGWVPAAGRFIAFHFQ